MTSSYQAAGTLKFTVLQRFQSLLLHMSNSYDCAASEAALPL